MNPDVSRTDLPKRDLDDEQLGALVRGVADDWRMPPQRLDQPTWRDRARSRSGHRRPWLLRLAGPATSAVAATVILALAAVWLTAPRGDRGTVGQSPSASAPESPSLAPESTPLPKLVRNGALPSVTQVMVRAEGQYRLADLATGDLGDDSLGSYSGPTALVPRSGGGWLCVCGKFTTFGLTGATGLSMTLAGIDPDGNVGERVEIRRVEGAVDPERPAEIQFQLVDGNVSVTPDGKTAFFAWTAKEGGEGWTSGIDVIDVATGTVVGSTPLPVESPVGAGGQPVSRNAPSVKVAPAGDRILMASFWFVEDPNDAEPPAGTDRWSAALDGQAIGAITRLATTTPEECGEFDYGLIDSASYYLICGEQAGGLTVRRFGLDGSAIGDTALPRTDREFSGGSLVARSGNSVFIWDPVAEVLSRVDLGTGSLTSSQSAASSEGGPADAIGAIGRRIGNWIAPAALAKLLLDPGIVVSPDGGRVYAIGVGSPGPAGRGSTGIYAFDATSLAQVGHWDPTADFISIAVSADGEFVYASALGGVDADGVASRNGASVTVFDATDGSVRLIAGKLGSTDLWFANRILE
jgi:hypothetical protein